MESYVEVSFLFAFVTSILCMRIAGYCCIKVMKRKDILVYAAASSLSGCLFLPYAWLISILIEVLFFLFYFRCLKKVFLLGFAIRGLVFFSVFAWYGGSFHNSIYFVPLQESLWLVWVIYAGIWYMLQYKWKQLLAKANYVYQAKLLLPFKEVKVKAYLDSGNMLTHKTLPVVFLDAKYSSYFDKNSIELVVMNTIQSTGVLRCHECRMSIDGGKVQRVYVCCESSLTLPFHCEVLLNMNAMTLG